MNFWGFAPKKNQLEQAYNNATLWEGKLKMYCDAVEQTEKQTNNIESVLLVFKSQLDVICNNTDCLIQVIEILYCLIKESFECMDDLKEKLTIILKEIECLDLPDLNSRTSIVMQCLTNICTKIDEAKASQRELIKNTIIILKCAQQLNEMICGKCCSIRYFINEMCEVFGIIPIPESNTDDCDNLPGTSSICGCEIESCEGIDIDQPEFPIETSTYYCDTKEQYEKAKEETKCLKDKFDKKRKKCEELKSCKKSLEDAIKTSKEAKECK